jgi:hypothetical protein
MNPSVLRLRLDARRTNGAVLAALLLAIVALAPLVSHAAATVPVRVRIIKGARQGPAAIDPRLADLTPQLGRLAYQRWDQVGEHDRQMEFGKPVSFPLPDGATLELTLADARKDTVTFDVRVPAHRTHSRLTIAKNQRIVQQVADEKDGTAYFATVRPWP